MKHQAQEQCTARQCANMRIPDVHEVAVSIVAGHIHACLEANINTWQLPCALGHNVSVSCCTKIAGTDPHINLYR